LLRDWKKQEKTIYMEQMRTHTVKKGKDSIDIRFKESPFTQTKNNGNRNKKMFIR